jgi:cyclophilin family peptidyl-prolyl cis-trans isomerase
MKRLVLALLLSVALVPPMGARQKEPAAGPQLVIETVKGTIEVRLFAADAPKSVAQVLALVKRGFYRGLRVHRVTPALAQFGDPLTRDMSRKAAWGSGGSGNPIGVAEISKRHSHQRGTVALAHGGSPTMADSQLYIMKVASPGLDGKHTIVGQVTSGMAVVDKLAVPDIIKQISIK